MLWVVVVVVDYKTVLGTSIRTSTRMDSVCFVGVEKLRTGCRSHVAKHSKVQSHYSMKVPVGAHKRMRSLAVCQLDTRKLTQESV